MPKTYALLLVALGTSVVAIAFAYVVGQRSAEHRFREDVALSRAEREAIVAELRRDLAPPAAASVVVDEVDSVDLGDNGVEASPPAEEIAIEAAPLAPIAEGPSEGGALVAELAEVAALESEPAPPAPEADAEPELPATAQALLDAPVEEVPATPIARDLFDGVALGAAYAEVAQKFGREGRAALTMNDANGAQTKHYIWQWTGPAGEACRVELRFVDGRLTGKTFRE